MYLALLTPSFIISPGLLQKVFGARDDRAVRLGVGLNAAALFAYALMPVLLGMAARVLHPDLASRELALPYLFMHDLPFWVGALGLAAVFSAEVSAADAVLFMLATSLSQDLYKRFINPAADDRRVLMVARGASIAGGAAAVIVALQSKTIVDALVVFYTLVGVSLFVPIVAGLYLRRPGAVEALAAVTGGVIAVVAAQLWNGGRPIGWFTPAMIGLAAAAAAFGLAGLFIRRRD
jgi:SSS family solute:Na+ symporter